MFPVYFPGIFINACKYTLCLSAGSGNCHINVIRQFFFSNSDGRLYTARNTVLGGTVVRGLPDDLSCLRINFPDRNLCSGAASPAQTERGADIQVKVSVLHRQNRSGVGVIQNILHPYKLQGIQIQAHQIAAVISNKKITVIDGCAVLHAKPVGTYAGTCSVVAPFHNMIRIDGQGACFRGITGIQFDQIKNSVLAWIDQGICGSIHKGGGIKVA